MKKPSAVADGFDFFDVIWNYSAAGASTAAESTATAIVSTTATVSTATAVVSAATVSSAAASDFYKIQQLKQQQQLNLKILFHLNLI